MSPPDSLPNGESRRVGPHPGVISSGNQFTTEGKIRARLRDTGCDASREVQYRLQGVQLIDSVRTELRLPVRTFDTACVYFHKFRLNFPEKEYNYQDAALASLFVACKVEDTIKKSKDILAAAYNVRNPDKPTSADDKIFDGPSKTIIGLERLILETIGFDFRTRYPQKLLVKTIRRLLLPTKRPSDAPPSPSDRHDHHRTPETAKSFFATAYAMSIDLYKTFVPLKRTTFAMVLALVELTARVTGGMADILSQVRALADSHKARYSRTAVTETMLDLLDLYVSHGKATRVGVLFDQGRWMEVMIQINAEREKSGRERYLTVCGACEEAEEATSGNNSASTGPAKIPTPTTPASTASESQKRHPQQQQQQQHPSKTQESTMRFMFDPESARAEKDAASRYFNEEFEEYEVEVDEPVPPPPQMRRDDWGRGRGRGRGGMMRGSGGGGGGGGGYWRGGDRGSSYGGGYRGDRGSYRGRYH